MTDTEVGTVVDVHSLVSDGPVVGTLSTTVEPIIHGIVGAMFGDLEFDVGKSVRWTQWFIDDLFIMDINVGDQRYWVINWSVTFPEAEYGVSGQNFFRTPVSWRQEQFRVADTKLHYKDEDWVLFIDSHEGATFDTRSLPNDYAVQPFKSWIYREIQRATDAGQTIVYTPFFVYLKYTDTQTITYPSHAGPNAPSVSQSLSVPWYLPAGYLARLIKVSTLRSPSFDWSSIDQPRSDAAMGDAAPEAAYLNTLLGTASTPDPGPLPNEVTFVYRLRGPVGTGSAQSIASQWGTPQNSWAVRRQPPGAGTLYFHGSVVGTDNPTARGSVAQVPTGADEYLAQSIVWNSGGRNLHTTWASSNGTTWTATTSSEDVGAAISLFDSNNPVTIGAGVGPNWDSRIYSVEARTGLHPTAGGNTASVPGYITFPSSAHTSSITLPVITTPTNLDIMLRFKNGTPLEAAKYPLGNFGPNLSWGVLTDINGGLSLIMKNSVGGNIGAAYGASLNPTGYNWWRITHTAATGVVEIYCQPDSPNVPTTWGTVRASATTSVTVPLSSTAQIKIGNGGNAWFGELRQVILPNHGFNFNAATDLVPSMNPASVTTIVTTSGHSMTVTRGATPLTIVPTTAGRIWKFDASDISSSTPVLDDTLDVDANSDGIADGWQAYVAGTVASASRSVQSGYQRITGNPNGINTGYGVQLTTQLPVTAGQVVTGAMLVRFVTADPAAVTATFYPQCYRTSDNAALSTAGTAIPVLATPTWIPITAATAPAQSGYMRPYFRIYGQTAAANGTLTGTLDVFAVKMFIGTQSYTDPRGRAWTVTNPAAVVPYQSPDTKLSVISYAYAHWNKQDIPPGQTTVPALTAENDLGYQMRNLMSLCRPIPGIPFGTPWQPPNTDPVSYPGPWAVDMYAATDPQLVATIEEKGHTLPDKRTAPVGVPLYDIAMRLNLRDGLWYERGVSGNIPLTWDDTNQVWVPLYDPDTWPQMGVAAEAIPPPGPANLALLLDGNPGTYVFAQDANYFDFADQESFTLVAVIAPNSWTPSARQVIVSKWDPPSQRSWYWAIEAGGGLVLSISRDGTTPIEVVCDLDDAPGLAGLGTNQMMYLAVTYFTHQSPLVAGDPIKDQVDFWAGTDLDSWAALCAQPMYIDNPSSLNLFASFAGINVGAIDDGASLNFAGYIRLVSIRRGVADYGVGGDEVGLYRGDTVLDPAFDRYGNLWDIHGGYNFQPIPTTP